MIILSHVTSGSPVHSTTSPATGGPAMAATPRIAEMKLNASESEFRPSILSSTGLVQPTITPVNIKSFKRFV